MKNLVRLLVVFGLIPLAQAAWPDGVEPFATSALQSRSKTKATGTVDFGRAQDGVLVRIQLRNVKPGLHALHVHANGNCAAADASSAGDHFNPTGRHHGAPSDIDRHVGDFGNIEVGANGEANAEMRFANVTGFDWKDFVGRSVVLHAGADDLKSQPAGNSGARIACGVIRASNTRAAR